MKAKKSLGQDFLQDENIIDKIVESVDVKENDLIIEIGPGQGALTRKLKNKKSFLIAFEIDERMHECLDNLEDDRTKIVYNDILNVDIIKEISIFPYKNIYVVANLPYYITTPIIEKLITLNVKIGSIVVMVQKEVAERFSALPRTKDYGYMTVKLNALYNVKKLFIVKNTCFNPVPKVDSAVVKLELKKENNKLVNKENFDKLISAAFSHKRKTLKNNLSNETWEKILPYLVNNNINLNARAEELSVDIFIDLSNLL